MPSLISRSKFCVSIVVALCSSVASIGQNVRFKPVSREVIESRLGKYAGKDSQRETTLKQMFIESGCDDQHITEQTVKGSKIPNLICVLPGSSDRTIIVGAHFDYEPRGDGVVDNWSGASLLPSLYEAAKSAPRQHTYIFVGFTAEERGEVGSRFYARQMTSAQVAATNAMVNLDTLGLGAPEVWVSHSDKQLVAALAYVAHFMKVPVGTVNVEQIGSTDSVQFSERKIPSITIHSLTQEKWNEHIIHSSNDRISAIRLGDYFQTYRLLAAYITYLDEATTNADAIKSR